MGTGLNLAHCGTLTLVCNKTSRNILRDKYSDLDESPMGYNRPLFFGGCCYKTAKVLFIKAGSASFHRRIGQLKLPCHQANRAPVEDEARWPGAQEPSSGARAPGL